MLVKHLEKSFFKSCKNNENFVQYAVKIYKFRPFPIAHELIFV